jgi:hypothetical protein
MRRRLFNFAATASLLLFLMVAAIALRSVGRHGDLIQYSVIDRPPHRAAFIMFGWRSEWIGVIWTEYRTLQGQKLSPRIYQVPGWSYQNLNSAAPLHLFGYRRYVLWHSGSMLIPYPDGPTWFEQQQLAAPVWLLFVATSALPRYWVFSTLRRRRRKRWAAAGCCVRCGYDLRATPQPNGPLLRRCPECGAEPPGHEDIGPPRKI